MRCAVMWMRDTLRRDDATWRPQHPLQRRGPRDRFCEWKSPRCSLVGILNGTLKDRWNLGGWKRDEGGPGRNKPSSFRGRADLPAGGEMLALRMRGPDVRLGWLPGWASSQSLQAGWSEPSGVRGAGLGEMPLFPPYCLHRVSFV